MTNTHKLSQFSPKWWCDLPYLVYLATTWACDPLPVVPLGLEFQSCRDDTHAWSGGIWMCQVFSLMVVLRVQETLRATVLNLNLRPCFVSDFGIAL